ncbi:MAG: Asp-tRNA(Asn)/Glu-tRNA(Gln) amidotransferase GatCAB subunit B, partial [Ignavibacteria bacterium]|nr:Asp-tRNA(Asn)/Glu-tRNA(Gln) amidotransferase GatCAB subunit B [Ignavibacteria bacterium]
VGTEAFGVKTEIKNLNSISNIEKAIQAEVIRQTELLESNQVIEQATRRYDDVQKNTILMRKKEGSVDYKYFPEPNITPVLIDSEWLKSIRDNLPELPDHREKRYMDAGLNAYDAGQLIQNKALSDFFDQLIKDTSYVKLAANWCLSDILANFSQKQLLDKSYDLKYTEMAQMINALGKQEISSKQAKDIFVELLKGNDYHSTVKKLSIEQVSDQSVLEKMVEEILNENEQSILDYHNGKDRALGFLMGQIMKKSKGQANPVITNQLLIDGLMKRKP